MKATKLSAAAAKQIGTYSSKSLTAAKDKVKTIDLLVADNVTSDMLKAPAKGADTAFFDSVKAAIVTGFTATNQALLKKDTKSLSDQQKSDKRYWQQQVGALVNDLQRAMVRREAQMAAGSDGAGGSKSSWESVKRTALAEMIKQAQAKDASKIKDIAAFIKDLQSALARIPANA
jgi:hypothetical protein